WICRRRAGRRRGDRTSLPDAAFAAADTDGPHLVRRAAPADAAQRPDRTSPSKEVKRWSWCSLPPAAGEWVWALAGGGEAGGGTRECSARGEVGFAGDRAAGVRDQLGGVVEVLDAHQLVR